MQLTYDGNLMLIRGDVIFCPSKNATAYLSKIRQFVLEDRVTLRKKRLVGHNDKGEPLYMWEDETHVHIGCLKETSGSFQEKFFQVLNQ